MESKLKIAIFVDYDNIEIGVKSTLQREFDVALVLDALKERGDIIAKYAYANWERQVGATRQMAENAVQMVQRIPSPRGDKNGADINLALDTLEMAFTHGHVNAFAIISGDSDFISLVNKLKEYGKTVFVVGGKAFTSTILQRNCHEFISYESLLEGAPKPVAKASSPPRRSAPLDSTLSLPLVERALEVLGRREIQPQLGVLKSTMLQLDPTFSERAYGAGSFKEFVDKLQTLGLVEMQEANRRLTIRRVQPGKPEKTVRKAEQSLPLLRDVLETHRLELEGGAPAGQLAAWVQEEQPDFDWKQYGFQEFAELLNYAQDKLLVRVEPQDEEGLRVFLGAEFYPPVGMELPTAAPPPSLKQPKRMPANLPMQSPGDVPAPKKRAVRKKGAGSGQGAAGTPRKRQPRRGRATNSAQLELSTT